MSLKKVVIIGTLALTPFLALSNTGSFNKLHAKSKKNIIESFDDEDFDEDFLEDEEEPNQTSKQTNSQELNSASNSINFSARNIPVRDAFATLARISGKSITVSGDIQDRQTISVVEINDLSFNDAFLNLVRAAGVDFVARGENNFTILRANSRSDIKLFSSLESSLVDTSLPLEERKTDLVYDNKDISSIIKDLANLYGVDIILTAQPTERVTVKLKDVNINDALTLILAGSQFKHTKSDSAYVIYNSSNKNFSLYNETAFITLNYLDSKEVLKLLPEDIKKLAKSSEKQNALIADGSAEDITKLKNFIKAVDKPIPQVELDVKLVELSESLNRGLSAYNLEFGLGRVGKFTPNLTTPDAGDLINSSFNLNLGDEEFQIFNGKPTYNQNSANAQIKVSQKLLVTSGKSAQINFDQDINVVLNAANPGGGGQPIGVVQTQQIQRITAGNSLSITPIVGHGGVITVEVEVEVSANGDVNQDTGVPRDTTRRKISSEVQIPTHKTIVIGGIFDDQKTRSTSNEIPLLSKIPIIGDLFGNTSRSKSQTELMILITPHIKDADAKNLQRFYSTT